MFSGAASSFAVRRKEQKDVQMKTHGVKEDLMCKYCRKSSLHICYRLTFIKQ